MNTYQSHQFNGAVVITDCGKRITLSNDLFLGAGRDGEVFQVDEQYAVKMYFDNPICESLCEKLKLICSNKTRVYKNVVKPLQLVRLQGQSPNDVAGFIMKFLPNAKSLTCMKWKSERPPSLESTIDQTIANFIYSISKGLVSLHQNRIVMGDLKPENILVSNNEVYLIDIDSCSILPDYPGDSFTIQYVDPKIREGVPDSRGPYEFTPQTDWWALGIIAFELFMGVSPWAGNHPAFRKTPLAFRSHAYSAVLFDERVNPPPPKFVRDRSWLKSKPRIEEYFSGIFSNSPQCRVPMTEALSAYFPVGQCQADVSRIIQHIESLLRNDTERKFLERFFDDLRQGALNNSINRERARTELLNMMFSPEMFSSDVRGGTDEQARNW